MTRLLRRRSSRAVIAQLQDDLREANGNLWKAANREFDLQCENRILRDVVAAYGDLWTAANRGARPAVREQDPGRRDAA